MRPLRSASARNGCAAVSRTSSTARTADGVRAKSCHVVLGTPGRWPGEYGACYVHTLLSKSCIGFQRITLSM